MRPWTPFLRGLQGSSPLEIGCIASAAERDLFNPADVRTVGDDPAALAVPDFRKPSAYTGARGGVGRRVSLALLQRFGRIYAPRPGVISGACIGCRKCERICPVPIWND